MFIEIIRDFDKAVLHVQPMAISVVRSVSKDKTEVWLNNGDRIIVDTPLKAFKGHLNPQTSVNLGKGTGWGKK